MIYALEGSASERGRGFFVLRVGGFFLKITANERTLNALPEAGGETKVFCALRFRGDDGIIEIFGFLKKEDLELFELLTSVSGVGSRTALRVLELGEANQVMASIVEEDVELLSKAPGIGKKTAGRLILELKSKVRTVDSAKITGALKIQDEVIEVLCGLGYDRRRVKETVAGLNGEAEAFETKLKEALRRIGGIRH